MKLYQAIANNAANLRTPRFVEAAEERAKRIADVLPSGSGFDNGTKLEYADDTKIVFTTSYHHMNENGYYDGWTSHRITARANLIHGVHLTVTGRNRNDIKDCITEVFDSTLNLDFDWIVPEAKNHVVV